MQRATAHQNAPQTRDANLVLPVRHRMGIFSENQPLYAECGIATFPIDGKKPAVRGYQKISLSGSSRIVSAFGDVDAMGFNAGIGSKITVIDIDSPDEQLWLTVINRFGNTSVKVRTPAGGLHLWYRHNGERRKIRFEQGLPVDILGAGVVVAPPSLVSKGQYQFLEGSLSRSGRYYAWYSPF